MSKQLRQIAWNHVAYKHRESFDAMIVAHNRYRYPPYETPADSEIERNKSILKWCIENPVRFPQLKIVFRLLATLVLFPMILLVVPGIDWEERPNPHVTFAVLTILLGLLGVKGETVFRNEKKVCRTMWREIEQKYLAAIREPAELPARTVVAEPAPVAVPASSTISVQPVIAEPAVTTAPAKPVEKTD